MDQLAPQNLKEGWDNVGLMIGYPNKMVENLMVTLEVTEAVIDEAIEKNVDMIISHHPLIYKPLKKVVEQDPIGHMVLRLIKNDINLFVAHTNLDVAYEGTSKRICDLLDLNRVDYIIKNLNEVHYKLQVFVPETSTRDVMHAMTQAGAGKLGGYEACGFMTSGQGQFLPKEGANPTIGEVNRLTYVKEDKLEVIVSKDNRASVIQAMIKAHPYEMPAYDLIMLENDFNPQGIGMYGFLDKAMTLKELTYHVKDILKSDYIRFIGPEDKKIYKVGVITGAGADYMADVKAVADVLLTGDMKYHEAQSALQMDLSVIDAGHFETEQIYVERLADILRNAFEEKSYDVQVIESEVNINPFNSL